MKRKSLSLKYCENNLALDVIPSADCGRGRAADERTNERAKPHSGVVE